MNSKNSHSVADLEPTANVPRLIDIFKKQYEENPRVVLRELIQNAADAITATIKSTPENPSCITVEILSEEERKKYKADIAVRDTAKGMTYEDLKKYLACLGATTKADESMDTIGEYGIGFYAIAVVCKSAIVVSKTLETDPVICRYLVEEKRFSEVDEITKKDIIQKEYYALAQKNQERFSGTTVFLEVDFDNNPQLRDWLNHERLAAEMRYFCLLIPFPILLWSSGNQSIDPINLPSPPWRLKNVDQKESLKKLWKIILPYTNPSNYPKFYFCFDEELKQGKNNITKISGIVYILENYGGGSTSVYYKHMYVEHAVDLIPWWGYPFTILLNVVSVSNSPLHITVPPSRTHIIRNDAYFKLSEIMEDILIRAINNAVQEYQNRLQMSLAGLTNPEKRSEKVEEINSQSEIIKALDIQSRSLPNICIDLCGTIADAFSGNYNDRTLKDAAIELFGDIRLPNATHESLVSQLRKYDEINMKGFWRDREAQKGSKLALQFNPPSSKKFLESIGQHVLVRVVIKEYPAGRQPHFKQLRIPLSCLSLLDPSLVISEAEKKYVRVPVLAKGDPTEYLLAKQDEKVVIFSPEIEFERDLLLFLMCISQTSNDYRLELVSAGKTLFQEVAKPDEWTDMLKIMRMMVQEGVDIGTVKRSGEEIKKVDVAGFEKKAVPLVMREVNGNSHFTINAWNRGMRTLNDTLHQALQHGFDRAEKAIHLILHELFHSSLCDENISMSQARLHNLNIREEALIEICELLMELIDIRKRREETE